MEKNSSMAAMATNAATIATSQLGPHQIAAITKGMRIAAVSTRRPVPELMRSLSILRFCIRKHRVAFLLGSRVPVCVFPAAFAAG